MDSHLSEHCDYGNFLRTCPYKKEIFCDCLTKKRIFVRKYKVKK